MRRTPISPGGDNNDDAVTGTPDNQTTRDQYDMNMKKALLAVAVSGAVLTCLPGYAADSGLKTDEQKFSYVVGVQIGNNLIRQGLNDVDLKAMNQAISDVLKGHELRLTQDEMKAAYEAKQLKMKAEHDAMAAKAKTAEAKFLAENKTKPGVKTLDSGIQYKVLKEGNGKKPTLDDSVTVNYRGSLINGTEFDSSYKRGQPATFALASIIEGWKQVLPLMSVGSKWQVVIPSELAYGERGAGSKIGPNETLIFEIELVGIEPPKKAE